MGQTGDFEGRQRSHLAKANHDCKRGSQDRPDCGFHDTWTLSPRSFGHSFHAHLDT
ncbi:hypothetical protein [Pseudomonas putida]|uniref:hypothetical protein n=1 Tax=Pseudomonas putida TaxID=303 RepID=UPI001EE7E997|nr:hypothetical protein [Pseudomonas putida]